MLYRPPKESSPSTAVFLMAKGRNTSWLLDKTELRLTSNTEVSRGWEDEPSLPGEEDVECVPEDLDEVSESAESDEELEGFVVLGAGSGQRAASQKCQAPEGASALGLRRRVSPSAQFNFFLCFTQRLFSYFCQVEM